VTPPRTAWLAFALLGILATVLLLEFPIAGLLFLVLAIAGMLWRPPRGASFAGLVTGIGGTWTGLMVRVKVSCDAFDAVPGQGCESPGIEGWIAIGAVILAVGVVATVFVVVRGQARTRT
jgi:hypothetical protein